MFPVHPEQLLFLHHQHAREVQHALSSLRRSRAHRDRVRAVRLAAKAERLSVRAARRALAADPRPA